MALLPFAPPIVIGTSQHPLKHSRCHVHPVSSSILALYPREVLSPLAARSWFLLPYACSSEPQVCHLPQTIEYALRCAQHATARALTNGLLRLVVELPMGRSRRHWYRMSPMDMIYEESALLALHFCEMFKGARVRVVTGSPVAVGIDITKVPWITRGGYLEEEVEADSVNLFDVVVISAVGLNQVDALNSIIRGCLPETAVVLLNCFLEEDVSVGVPKGFTEVYMCRAVEKGAILKPGAGEPWNVFSEIAVFEYDWACQRPATWRPTPVGVERQLISSGAERKSVTGYYKGTPGREAGYWPFMTIASPLILPIQGRPIKQGRAKRPRAPFGFF